METGPSELGQADLDQCFGQATAALEQFVAEGKTSGAAFVVLNTYLNDLSKRRVLSMKESKDILSLAILLAHLSRKEGLERSFQ